MIRRSSLALALAALAAAAPAAAEDALRPPATAAEAAPRVRASHRVDVIGPGERVDTVLNRARTPGAAARSAASAETLPVRPPEVRSSRPPPPEPVRPGPGPRGGSGAGPARGDAPPPERPRSR